jgi:hypothetical protein
MKNVEKDQIELVEGWSRQYGHPVSLNEVQEINQNLSLFFNTLLRWEEQFEKKGLIDEFGNIRD